MVVSVMGGVVSGPDGSKVQAGGQLRAWLATYRSGASLQFADASPSCSRRVEKLWVHHWASVQHAKCTSSSVMGVDVSAWAQDASLLRSTWGGLLTGVGGSAMTRTRV